MKQGEPGQTLYGALITLLRARKKAGGGPITLQNCDNLRHNGDRVRGGLRDFAQKIGDTDILSWIDANVRFPNAMVDRITPRPPAELKARVKAATGRDDNAALGSESYLQWVIEDNFAAGRPAWEKVGAELVASVDPYEEAKIRLLNATHSCIAWGGTLRGHEYIHEGARDAVVRKLAFDYATDDVIPCLSGPDNPVDLPAYRDMVLERFGNDAIRDTNQRVTADSFSKIPGFILPTIRGMADEGTPFTGFLYAGLMIGRDGSLNTLEFNCRLGDPETQAILSRLKTPLGQLIQAGIDGRLDQVEAEWDRRSALCVVLAAAGYPAHPELGDVITGHPAHGNAEGGDLFVYHAGTAQKDQDVVTSGGRVLGVTGLGDSLKMAQTRAYEGVRGIHFNGMQYRSDIGHLGLPANQRNP